jgi:hypothetical protein
MSTQRIVQLLFAILVITAIAVVSDRSRVLASILSVMPMNITIALWFVYGDTSGDPEQMAGFARMVLLGLIPTASFVALCWFGLGRGWPLWRVLVIGYAVWVMFIVLYRILDRR